jgi:DNA-binding response OmpR family regulator
MHTSDRGASSAPDGPAPRLLMVDDEGAILFASADYFRSHGFVVDTASELEQAQGLLAHERYDFVVSDLCLLGLSVAEGLAVSASAGAARSRPYTVLISAYLTPDAEREARKRGIDLVMRKPVPPAVLKRTLLDLRRGER